MSHRVHGRPWLIVLAMVLLVLIIEQVVEHFAQRAALVREKNSAHQYLSNVRARLEGVIDANLLLVHGLTAVVAAHPDIDQSEFSRISHGLFDGRHALQSIAAAPDMVISMVYPLQENRAALGLDFRTHPTQGAAARRVMETGQAIVSGPLQLAQGGSGVVVREPVYLPASSADTPPRFWGLVSAVINVDTLYRQAGLLESHPTWRLALRGVDGAGEQGAVFWGDAAVFTQDAVTSTIALPGGSWQIAAVPVQGWGQVNENAWLIRLMSAMAAVVVGLVAYRMALNARKLMATVEALREQRDIMNRSSYLVHVGGWQLDVKPAQVFLAEGAERIYEFPGGSDLTLEQWLGVFHGPMRKSIDAAMVSATVRAESFDLELEILTPTGKKKWVRTLGLPVLEDGQVIRIDGAAQDVSQRKAAELLLEKERQLLSNAQKIARMGGWEFDFQRRKLRWSTETYRIFGLTENSFDLRIQTFLGLMHADCFEQMQDWLNALFERRSPGEIEVRILRSDGQERMVCMQGFLECDEAGNAIHAWGTVQDITERKQTEARAQQGEMVIDSVFSALSDMFVLMDEKGVILDCRVQRLEDFIVLPQPVLGQRMQDVLPTLPARLFSRAFSRMHAQGRGMRYEYGLVLEQGARRFEARLNPLPGGTQFIAVVRDITRQYVAHRAVKESEARYRELFFNNPVPMMIYKRDGLRFLSVNEAFLAQYGYSMDDIQSMCVLDLYAQEDGQRFADGLPALKGLAYVGEWRHFSKDGTAIDVEIHSHDLDYRGEAARISVLSDITQRKRMEAEIRRFNVELEARVEQRTTELANVNKELETFTYSVSHDLKAPLRGIDGYSRLLREDYADGLGEEGKLFVANICSGVEQMNRLIEDLLTYSRSERGTLLETDLDLNEVFENILAMRQVELKNRAVLVNMELNCRTVRADRDGLNMVLGNLIDNAVKFSAKSQPPVIDIRVENRSDKVLLSITDNGIGFDMQFHERIFDIFQRLQRVEDYPGTGIGLAIVRRAVRRMGGRVWAESQPGAGATFFLELPC